MTNWVFNSLLFIELGDKKFILHYLFMITPQPKLQLGFSPASARMYWVIFLHVENNENLFNNINDIMNYLLKGPLHLLVYTQIRITSACYIWTSRWNVVSLTLTPCRTFHQISAFFMFLQHVKMLIPYQK